MSNNKEQLSKKLSRPLKWLSQKRMRSSDDLNFLRCSRERANFETNSED
jgi:hypothetical protein